MKRTKSHLLFRVSLIALILRFTCIISNAQPAPHQLLLALSKQDHTLAIVDPSTLKVITKVPVGEDPHEVIASSDGKTAYVSIYGGGSLHTINVIDLIGYKRLDDIDTRPLFGPHGLTFVNNKLWFTVEGSKAIGCYNPSTKKIEWAMGTGQDRTHMIYVTNNAKRIYTTNVASGTVSILQDTLVNFGPPRNVPNNNLTPTPPGNMPPPNMPPHENWEQTVVTVSNGSEGFDVSPDSAELWTASAENGKIYIIDLSAKKLEQTIDADVNGANRLKFTPDGRLVFISGGGILTVYDAKGRDQLKQIDITGGAGILMQPDGSRAYVACNAGNYVAVIDLKTLDVINKIDVGGRPDGLAWAERP
jgi:YVTN family beta-propeller protein